MPMPPKSSRPRAKPCSGRAFATARSTRIRSTPPSAFSTGATGKAAGRAADGAREADVTTYLLVGLLALAVAAACTAGEGAARTESVLRIDTPSPPPAWALLERELLRT